MSDFAGWSSPFRVKFRAIYKRKDVVLDELAALQTAIEALACELENEASGVEETHPKAVLYHSGMWLRNLAEQSRLRTKVRTYPKRHLCTAVCEGEHE